MHNARALAAIAFVLAIANGFAAKTLSYPQGELVVNISSSLPEWRPHRAYNADEAQILTAIAEGLFVYDPLSMDPVPALAESWSVDKSNLVWTFTLRAGAKYSNGEPITASEVVESWFTLIDPRINAPYASLFDSIVGVGEYRAGAETDRAKVGIRASGDRTVTLTLSTPAEHLPKILCHHAFSVVHSSGREAALKDAAPANYVPVSSGPFTVQSANDKEIVFLKNANYWDASAVSLPSIRVLITDDADDITARFNRGEIHWLAGSTRIDRVLDRASIMVTPLFATEYFFFRSTQWPWNDSKVRNALIAAVPWADLRANYVIPAKTLVFPISGYPELPGITLHDVSKARELLAAAGIEDPSKLPSLEIRIPDAQPFSNLASILETAWKGLGLTVTVKALPYAEYYASLRDDAYAIGITTWIGDFADPLSFLEMFRPQSSLNDSGWRNQEYERLIKDASSAADRKSRYALLSKAEQLLLDEGVILPVAHNPALNVIDTNGLEGWYSNALDIHPFKFIRFGPKKPLPGVARAR
jgi:oligopeptide transport system substrate-binding protein